MNTLPTNTKLTWLDSHLSSGQRHYMYRLGLLALDAFMKERGFVSNMGESSTRLSYEKNRVLIDVAVKKPDNTVFVTSYAGYSYSKEKINAKVTSFKDFLNTEFVVQVIISDTQGTRQPIYVPLPNDLDKPAHYVLRNVLGIIAEMCREIKEVRDVFTEEAVKKAQSLPVEDRDASAIPMLPNLS